MNDRINSLPLLLILPLLLLPAFLQAGPDWKSEINAKLKNNDYEAARLLLETTLPQLEKSERQEALALLPFVLNKLGLAEEEKKALIDYFEEAGQNQPVLEFLDFSVFSQVLEYLGHWKETFPLIDNLNFMVPTSAPEDSIPDAIRLGFDLSTGAYYKLVLENQPLEGGFWEKGPHLVELPIPYSFEQPFSLNLDVFLKTGAITIKKRIQLEFKVETWNLGGQELVVQRQNARPVKNLQGEVALYIGDKLIFKATKYVQKKIPLQVTIPPPNPPGTKPYLVPQKDQYPFHGVSILDAISALSKVIQDWKKKPATTTPATYEKKPEIIFNFINPEKPEVRSRITIKIKPEKAEPYAR
jgi:hypothetical protein